MGLALRSCSNSIPFVHFVHTGTAKLSANSTVIRSSFRSTDCGVNQWQRELSQGFCLASKEIHDGSPGNLGYWRIFMIGDGEQRRIGPIIKINRYPGGLSTSFGPWHRRSLVRQ